MSTCDSQPNSKYSPLRIGLALVGGAVAIVTLTFSMASIATVNAAMMRPAFFSGKWAANEQLCNTNSGYVEFMPSSFKYAAAVDKMPTKVTYYQKKSDMVEVGLSHPAMTAKVVFVSGEGGTLSRESAEITMRDLSAEDWLRMRKMSNGMITPQSVEAKMTKFKAEVASYSDRLVRCPSQKA